MSARICQSCGAQLLEGARFCQKCGKEVAARVCQNCGAQLLEGARFCRNCGKEIITPPSPPPSLPQQSKRQKPRSHIVNVICACVIAIGFIFVIIYLLQPSGLNPSVGTPQQALEYGEQGIALMNEGRYEDAIAEFTKAIEIDPEFANAYANRGTAYAALNKLDPAIADFNRAIELSKYDSVTQFAQEGLNSLGQSPVTVQASTQAAEHNDQGVTLADEGKYDEAIAEFTKAIQAYPDYPGAYANLGMIYVATEQYGMALESFSTAIEIDSGDAIAYANRGIAYINEGEYETAIADLDQAIKLDPNDDAAWNNKGVALEELGKPEEATACYDNALKLNPGNENAAINAKNLAAGARHPDGVKGKLSFWNPKKPRKPYTLRRWVNYLPPSYVKAQEKATEPAGKTEPAPGIVTPPVSETPTSPVLPFIGMTGEELYNGTYSGLFTYEYRENRWDSENRKIVLGEWVNGSFTLTMTLQNSGFIVDDEVYVFASNVHCSDPAFGTGLGSVAGSIGNGRLPADPPTRPLHPSKVNAGIGIFFPNGTYINIFPYPYDGEGGLSVGFDGRTISPGLNPAYQNETWFASTPSGPFERVQYIEGEHWRYDVNYKSFSLTKSLLNN